MDLNVKSDSSPKHYRLFWPRIPELLLLQSERLIAPLRTKMSTIEIPIFGPRDGIEAVRAFGADFSGNIRLELNRADSYGQGGLTPVKWEVEQLLRSLYHAGLGNTSFSVMIRPRGPPQYGTDFLYSDDEFETMKKTLLDFKESQLMSKARGDGFVFGILKRSDSDATRLVVDRERTAELRRLAGPDFKCVFHRAFDLVISTAGNDKEWEEELEWLDTQKMAVLTSGGLGNADDNAGVLLKVLRKTSWTGQELIVGGGVRWENLEKLLSGMGGLAQIYARTAFRAVGMVLHSSFTKTVDGIAVFDSNEAQKFTTTLGMLIRTTAYDN
ncbi:copper homeostasis CutC domain-containing protein [Triangularia verruculosa]|uniref:Copper homeostasis protein cutC homolog n=1 Tax=Triangularia verruculosa TaxID=2587418 RepID=A0AAN6XCQ5_9PEZI|nr:copper homeostasis CutC domain-containing protein [Triangularia verruculosa]